MLHTEFVQKTHFMFNNFFPESSTIYNNVLFHSYNGFANASQYHVYMNIASLFVITMVHVLKLS
jgi:hypothetical protein